MSKIEAWPYPAENFSFTLEEKWGSTHSDYRLNIRKDLFNRFPGHVGLLDLNQLPKVAGKLISISHSRDLGGYAFADAVHSDENGLISLGFDLELSSRIQKSELSRVSRYQEEVELAPAMDLLWVAKEAGFKALSTLGTLRVLSDVQVLDWKAPQNGIYSFEVASESTSHWIASGVAWRVETFAFALVQVFAKK